MRNNGQTHWSLSIDYCSWGSLSLSLSHLLSCSLSPSLSLSVLWGHCGLMIVGLQSVVGVIDRVLLRTASDFCITIKMASVPLCSYQVHLWPVKGQVSYPGHTSAAASEGSWPYFATPRGQLTIHQKQVQLVQMFDKSVSLRATSWLRAPTGISSAQASMSRPWWGVRRSRTNTHK